jgi:tetratricopeptide (TPR) repeat protein
MIVKNAASTIRPCLASVAGIVDQIVIADTGCSDNTCEVASEFGAIIVSAPWQDHFAHARNAALAKATTDWILVLDADEELGAEATDSLLPLLSASGVGGYLVPIWEYLPFASGSAWTKTILANNSLQERAQSAPSYVINTLCRVFRRRDDIYFTGRVHEMVQPQIEAAGLTLELAPFTIHHYGHLVQAEAIIRKRLFYNDLLQKKLADDDTDVTTLTMCAHDEWEVHQRPAEALRLFRRALEIEPRAFETQLLMAKVLLATKQYEEALAALDVVQHWDKDVYLQCALRGDALLGLGRAKEAQQAYRRALAASPGDRLLQCLQDYIEIELGDGEAALARLKTAAAELPTDVKIHELLVSSYIRMARIAEAAAEAERFCKVNNREMFLIRAARLHAQARQWDRAGLLSRVAVAIYPGSAEAHELLMMAMVTAGRLSEAAEEAELLTSLVNEPRSFLRAAGIYSQLQDAERAADVLRRGLRLHPGSSRIESALMGLEPLDGVTVERFGTQEPARSPKGY